ncbi:MULTISPECIES: hypothetical protein [unclassified Pseudoalteromonas]|uniref:hypothetical protein n=1 Tax=unclassified Pseudoalteromonas TaxID=194690 RepID=UPI000CF6B655|nr:MULTISPECIES: hypothetical protein [unclassified Pseudoalteromonas]MBS3796673.1 hypothetical protein [Pseudoalteromonas sp. BDTF-M6]
MKLKLLDRLKKATIAAPVNFTFAGETIAMTLHVRVKTNEELEKITSGAQQDKEIVKELLAGWEDFQDEGKDVPFSDEVLEQLLSVPAVTGRLSVECINANYRVQEKN